MRSNVATELAAMRESLNELQNKLAQIEAKVISEPVLSGGYSSAWSAETPSASPALRTHSPWLAGVNVDIAHPSQEKFGVEEAVVSELVDYFEKEKTCGVEPGNKPCDHCSMCSSRGF